MKLFEKQVFIALSSKEQNIKAGSHCNFMIFQWEPDLTFFKWSKNWKHGHSKQAPVAKKAEKCPKIAQTLHLKSENGPLRIYPLFLTTLDCFCGTLVGKTELKCTKNFKALNLNFIKCKGTGFWRFGSEMQYLVYFEQLSQTKWQKIQNSSFLGKKSSFLAVKLNEAVVGHYTPLP